MQLKFEGGNIMYASMRWVDIGCMWQKSRSASRNMQHFCCILETSGGTFIWIFDPMCSSSLSKHHSPTCELQISVKELTRTSAWINKLSLCQKHKMSSLWNIFKPNPPVRDTLPCRLGEMTKWGGHNNCDPTSWENTLTPSLGETWTKQSPSTTTSTETSMLSPSML